MRSRAWSRIFSACRMVARSRRAVIRRPSNARSPRFRSSLYREQSRQDMTGANASPTRSASAIARSLKKRRSHQERSVAFMLDEPLLTVQHLKKYFPIHRGVFGRTAEYVKAVDDVSFTINRGETFGLVGESGCGKTTAGRAILRLHEPDGGSIRFDGTDLLSLGKQELRRKRRDMQIIFQDPYASLNPRMTIRTIVGEPFAIHGIASGFERETRIADLLKTVG